METAEIIGKNAQMPSRRTYKLSELSQKTGVGGKSIHHYVRIGLLPPPNKAHEKLALYDENHLRLLALTRELRRERRLPLSEIARLFENAGHDARVVELNLMAGVYESLAPLQDFQPADVPQREHGEDVGPELSEETFKALRQAGLIDAGGEALSPEGRKITRIVAAGLQKGLPLGFFKKLLDPVRVAARLESRAGLQAIDEDAGYRQTIQQAGEIDSIVNRFIEAVKAREMRLYFERAYRQTPISLAQLRRRPFVPSEAFLQKYQIPQQIADLEQTVESVPKDLERRLLLARAYQAIGRYEDALSHTQLLLAQNPDHLDARTITIAAELLRGETDKALQMAEQLYEECPDNARVATYCAMGHLIQAARSGGLISPVRWLRKSLNLFDRSEALKPGRPREQLTTLLLRGRAYTALPVTLERLDTGIQAFRQILSMVDAKTEKQLGLPFRGHNEIYRVNAYFFLAVAYRFAGNAPAAEKCCQQVLLRDPASDLAREIYEGIDPREGSS